MLTIFQRSGALLGVLVTLGALLPERAGAVVNYVVDDGTINSAVGVGGAGGDLMALNRFTVQAGGGEVTNVQVNWAMIANNSNAKLLIFNDPTNDGNPGDLVLLNQLDVTTQDGGGFNNTYTDYLFPTTPVSGEFYVGVLVSGMSGTDRPYGYDTTDPDYAGTSFFFENTTAGALDPSNPAATSTLSGFTETFIAGGNFMIRATGDLPSPTGVPEPSTAILLLAGLSGALGRRRRSP